MHRSAASSEPCHGLSWRVGVLVASKSGEWCWRLLISKVKEAAKRWEKQQKRGRLFRSVLADRDGNDLQRFANDIKDALQTLKVGVSYERTLLISMMKKC